MASSGARIGVAVSGGADSVALLHILHALTLDLLVLHVNHGLRDGESDADETFVRDLAASLALPIVVERAAPPSGNLEQAAREIRRDFFRRAMEQDRLARIAVGHTRSDQAETVLLRLF
ncbi:MAG TPA: tRNA lysidine(34) synthetase TilS, partial [Bryobacteraceae bacterium]